MAETTFFPVYFRDQGVQKAILLSSSRPSVKEVVARYYGRGWNPSVLEAISCVTLSEVIAGSVSCAPHNGSFSCVLGLDELWIALSGKELDVAPLGLVRLRLDRMALSRISRGRSGIALAETLSGLVPVKVRLADPVGDDDKPAVDEVYVPKNELLKFLEYPFVPGVSGRSFQLVLSSDATANLVGYGSCTVVSSGVHLMIRIGSHLPEGYSMVVRRHLWAANDLENSTIVNISSLSNGDNSRHDESFSAEAVIYPYLVTKAGQPVFVESGELKLSSSVYEFGVLLPNPIARTAFSLDLISDYSEDVRRYLNETDLSDAFNAFTLAHLISKGATVARTSRKTISRQASDLNENDLLRLKLQTIGVTETSLTKNGGLLQTPDAILHTDMKALFNSVSLLFAPENKMAAISLAQAIMKGANVNEVDHALVQQARRHLALCQIQRDQIALYSLCHDIWQAIGAGRLDGGEGNELNVFAARLDVVTLNARLGLDQTFLASRLTDDDVINFLAPSSEPQKRDMLRGESSLITILDLSAVDDCALKSLALSAARSFSDIKYLSSNNITNLESDNLVNSQYLRDFLRGNWSDVAYHILVLSDSATRQKIIADLFWEYCDIALPVAFQPRILGQVGDRIVVAVTPDILPDIQLFKSSSLVTQDS